MVRLDKYLAGQKNHLTRSKAKRAIKRGLVKVNGKVVKKPAYRVKQKDKVAITNRQAARMPAGYFKLRAIQEKTHIIEKDDVVLDLGSSAGGYLRLASKLAKKVYGIEYSKKFKKRLEALERKLPNVKVIIADVFKAWPSELTGGESVDVILNDLTADWPDSIASMHNVFPLLKPDGKILMTIKSASEQPKNLKALINKELAPHELKVEKIFELDNDKDEFYAVLVRK